MGKPPKAPLFMFHHPVGNKPSRKILARFSERKSKIVKQAEISLPGKKGISLIEILVAVSIIAVTLTSLLGLASFSLKTTMLVKETNQANNIAQEMMEQIRNLRDGTSWNVDGVGTLTAGINYYIQKVGDPAQWQALSGTETVYGFTKKAVFENVMRDGSDNIVEAGGINDADTRKVTVTVSWQERGRTHSTELITYLTNWRQ